MFNECRQAFIEQIDQMQKRFLHVLSNYYRETTEFYYRVQSRGFINEKYKNSAKALLIVALFLEN